MSKEEAITILLKIMESGILTEVGKKKIEIIVNNIVAEEKGINLWNA